MKNILFLLIISLLLISCWYESDYMGAIITPNDDLEDTNHITLTISKRENTDTLNNIIIARYLLKNTEKLQTPLKMSDVKLVKNAADVFNNDYITVLDYKESYKYFYIEAKISGEEIYIKDWDNKEHYLYLKEKKDNTNSWVMDLYSLNWIYTIAQENNITNQKGFNSITNELITAEFFEVINRY